MSKTGITRESLTSASGSDAQRAVHRRLIMRRIIDKIATRGIGLGGISVIVAVLLIFVFLFSEIVPLFVPAEVEPLVAAEVAEGDAKILAVDSDDRGEVLLRVLEQNNQQTLYFNSFENLGQKESQTAALALPFEAGQEWIYDSASNWFVVESNGRIKFGQLKETEVFKGGKRTLAPQLSMSSPEEGLSLTNDEDVEVKLLQVKAQANSLALGYLQEDAAGEESVHLQMWKKARDFMSGQSTFKINKNYKLELPYSPSAVYIDSQMRWAYTLNQKSIDVFRLQGDTASLYTQVTLDHEITSSSMLLGSKSLLIGDSQGAISQWSLVRDSKNNYNLQRLRSIKHSDTAIVAIQPEDRRRGFYALDAKGEVGIFFTTSERKLAQWSLEGFDIQNVKLISSPRSNALIAFDQNKIEVFEVDNQHPEVSFKSIWQKVWYEGYQSPEYIWQSSAATNDFEPKLSLSPLAYGTLKATFYAMLFALPLAICGAIYTAYFMAPPVRKKVKPCIEFMEALPTVILGFLAGIWLAPIVETYLPGVLLTLFLLPIVLLVVSFLWFVMPRTVRGLLPDGWEPVFLAPFVVGTVAICFYASIPLENLFFDGDAKIWMRDNLGIAYDQRNSLVVGIAMGFAVIPTIFSIAEDAIFAVPKSLTFGSLALGASPWQTLVRVILPTASPGIFSAVMIGTGRAVGETMIVLMATGSTPIMDMNIFEGFRTLSANIAIEMPEAEVHSTHYRLLFLAAFCLFIFTFMFNTTAEIVRQRLREKYGSL